MSDTAVSRISSTCAVPVTAEFGPEKNTYVRECVRQNTLLEEQNVLLRNQNILLKDIREKPVIQDSDVFSSYQRSQRSYFAATGRTGRVSAVILQRQAEPESAGLTKTIHRPL